LTDFRTIFNEQQNPYIAGNNGLKVRQYETKTAIIVNQINLIKCEI